MTPAAAIAIAALALAQPVMRGGQKPPTGTPLRVDAAGVWLGAPADAQPAAVLGWDRVRAIEGDLAGAAAAFAPVADLAWRARTRLERGDATAAEPLFEELFNGRPGAFDGYRGRTGPTAALVAEGLLRCRLRRGAHIAAIEPWLALLAARPAVSGPSHLHADWAAEAGLAPILDPATGLVPALPPIWLNWPSVQAMAGGEPPAAPADDRQNRAAILAALYHQAARFEAGLSVDLPDVTTTDPAITLVSQIVIARVGNAEQRAAARTLLAARITPDAEPWVEAWCRAAIGRSLVRESDLRLRQLGVVELLHLPARFRAAHPYLAGAALAESAATLRAMGDADGADRLAAELAEFYPDHPAADWPPARAAASGLAAGLARSAPTHPPAPPG